ncbi:DUF3806 domain-containing protein [Cytophagaceae bacterium DM2B3-1]|uniref:DUF3806 domain-containing protein n=1 Tax=Xanthocytophaga flava TaxID=3048013 RepID=A0ABT7CIV7_9BACT|nr:DUF3806 domain-containing protein [Xanthocytophaga flavus]MDJ1471080.1 DUF3806 domain-containing protein [Xanthocytophaga flavus]MDJ1492935.1 DUF3806 domain-containing protein [Xanthocytophaga flavus]
MKISELTEEQMELINSNLQEAREHYHAAFVIEDVDFIDCDEVCGLYTDMMYGLKSGEIESYEITRLVGTAFGHLFVTNKGFCWVEVEIDEDNVDMAVHNSQTGETVYPFNAVHKRVVNQESDAFICSLYTTF